MRTNTMVALLSATLLAVACGRDKPTASLSDELKHDLQLASSSATDLASTQNAKSFAPTEIAPQARPEKRTTLKKAAGPKVVRSKAPTVKAAPTTEVAESESSEMQVSTITAPDAAPAEPASTDDESLPAMPRPVPASIPAPSPGDQGVGQGTSTGPSTGEVIGVVLGGILGGVIRGGGVDGDHCEIHRPTRGRNRPQPRGGGVYSPNPRSAGGMMGGRGGITYVRSTGSR